MEDETISIYDLGSGAIGILDNEIARLTAELERVRAEYADYQRVAQQSTIESVMSGARLRGALAEVARILQQRNQEGWEERLLSVVNAALEGSQP